MKFEKNRKNRIIKTIRKDTDIIDYIDNSNNTDNINNVDNIDNTSNIDNIEESIMTFKDYIALTLATISILLPWVILFAAVFAILIYLFTKFWLK